MTADPQTLLPLASSPRLTPLPSPYWSLSLSPLLTVPSPSPTPTRAWLMAPFLSWVLAFFPFHT